MQTFDLTSPVYNDSVYDMESHEEAAKRGFYSITHHSGEPRMTPAFPGVAMMINGAPGQITVGMMNIIPCSVMLPWAPRWLDGVARTGLICTIIRGTNRFLSDFCSATSQTTTCPSRQSKVPEAVSNLSIAFGLKNRFIGCVMKVIDNTSNLRVPPKMVAIKEPQLPQYIRHAVKTGFSFDSEDEIETDGVGIDDGRADCAGPVVSTCVLAETHKHVGSAAFDIKKFIPSVKYTITLKVILIRIGIPRDLPHINQIQGCDNMFYCPHRSYCIDRRDTVATVVASMQCCTLNNPTTSSTTALIKEIVHMMDCVAGMKVLTHLPIYTDDRLSVEDYDCKIAFAALPSTGRVYKLEHHPVYIDNNHTTFVFHYPNSFYVITHKECHINVETPSAERQQHSEWVSGIRKRLQSCREEKQCKGYFWIDTASKPAMFDAEDLPC
ncbi:hypothetical protein RRG08_000865 [Elysia crispata]|uniref:Uncharacterized protein n=1 Tax=Elysia crispata TaxID=231223 RepID=A0AAE1AKP6_9GAST|nr:hypothetical protein RRG08_000865 [Elysia crispata]